MGGAGLEEASRVASLSLLVIRQSPHLAALARAARQRFGHSAAHGGGGACSRARPAAQRGVGRPAVVLRLLRLRRRGLRAHKLGSKGLKRCRQHGLGSQARQVGLRRGLCGSGPLGTCLLLAPSRSQLRLCHLACRLCRRQLPLNVGQVLLQRLAQLLLAGGRLLGLSKLGPQLAGLGGLRQGRQGEAGAESTLAGWAVRIPAGGLCKQAWQ